MFSGSYTVDVFSANMPLVEPDPDALKKLIFAALMKGRSLIDSLLFYNSNGFASKIESFRNYARDSYTLGLPTGMSAATTVLSDAPVQAAIEDSLSLETYGVAVDFNFVGPMSTRLAIMPFLLTSRGLKTVTNEITIYPAGLPTLEDYRIIYEFPEYAGNRMQVLASDVTLRSDKVTVDITYTVLLTFHIIIDFDGAHSVEKTLRSTTYTEAQTIPAALVFGQSYCIAQYRALDSLGVPAAVPSWWYYNIASGQYPSLSATYDLDSQANFLPVIPLRYDNNSMTREAVQDTPLYLTSKKLLKKLTLDFDEVTDRLEESPNIADIDHAYIMFGIDLQTTNQTSIAYLTEYFDYLHNTSTIDRWDVLEQYQNKDPRQVNHKVFDSRGILARTGYHVTEYIDEVPIGQFDSDEMIITVVNTTVAYNLLVSGLDTSMTFSYITSVIKHGDVGDGKIGNATLTKVAKPVGFDYRSLPQKLAEYYTHQSYIILRHQIRAGVYKEVTVYGLIHSNFIYDGECVVTTLDMVIENVKEHNFVIPLHYGIAKTLRKQQQNELYEQALLLVINSYVITEVEWYEEGFFHFLLLIAGVVIAIYTGQYELVVGMIIVEGIAVISPELSKIVGYIIMLYGGIQTLLQASETSILAMIKEMPTAQLLLKMSSAVLTATDFLIESMVNDIAEEYGAFKFNQTEDQKKLDAAKELLETSGISTFDLLADQQSQVLATVTETPTAFYDRTIHTGNIGTLVLSVIPNYHSMMLTLPEAKFA